MKTTRVGTRCLIAWLLPGMLFLLSGCLFSPRDPQAPTGGDFQYNNRTSPRLVWENLQISLNNADSFGWEENIHPEFTYLPDAEADAQFPGLFVGWNYAREQAFINGFYASGVSIESTMRNLEFTVPPATGSEVRWEGVIYYLRVTDPNDGSENGYRASAIITFRLEGNFWYIYSWEDQQGESDPDNETQILPSMGVLRGTFGSN